MRLKEIISVTSVLAILICLGGCYTPAGSSGGEESAAGTAETALSDIPGRFVDAVFPELDVTRDILYAEAVNVKGETEKLYLDLYEPGGDTAESRPAVIFVHGGGFSGGDKRGGIEQILAEMLAHKGYVTLSINYRLRAYPSSDWVGTYRDSANDAYAAFEWLVKNKDKYRADTGRIAFGGHSAGSNVVTELCYSDWSQRPVQKDGVFAVISMAGPQMIRGNLRKDDPFGILIHGERDELVPCALTEDLARKMEAAGTPHVLNVIPQCYHSQSPAIHEVEDVVTQYLYRAMTGRDAGIRIRRYEAELKRLFSDRLAQRPVYRAAEIAVVLDGKLDEWGAAEKLPLDKLKDAGEALPSAEDCTATGMAAWDPVNPSRLYFALTVTDDVFQEDGNPNFWENDALEILVDITDSEQPLPFMQWVVNVNGEDIDYSQCATGSCTAAVKRQGNAAVFEVAVDLSGAMPNPAGYSPEGRTIGFCLCYDDCEEGFRQHQIGLVAGSTLEPRNFANLVVGMR